MKLSHASRTFGMAMLVTALLLPGAAVLAAPRQMARGAGRALFSPEVMDQMRTLMEQKKLDLKHLPKVPFRLPVTRMVEERLTQAGVKVAPHSLESICYENVYWNGGPTVASATDGRVAVWGSQLGLYFASASDLAHPVVLSLGDLPMRIYIRGNQVVILGLWYGYSFDVTNPAHPSFQSILDMGAWQGYRALAWTPDGKTMVAVNEDWLFGGWGGGSVLTFDASTLNNTGYVYPGGFFGTTALSDVVVPDNPGNVAVVSGGAIPDPNAWGSPPQTLYFIDLSPPPCATPQPQLNVLGTIDCSATGNAGSLLAVGSKLYVNSRPFWSYNSDIDTWFYAGFGMPLPPPSDAMTVDVYDVPDFSDPSAATLATTYKRDGDDPVAWYPAAGGKVVLGSYQDRVLQMPPGLGDPITTVTLGDYSASGGSQTMRDLGWDASSGMGIGACGTRGARFFASLSGPETGHYWTGGVSQNPVLSGSYLLVPQGAAGLAVLDVSNGMNPVQVGSLEGTATTILAVSSDGNTAYATDGTAKVWALNISDKVHPSVIAGSTYAPAAPVTALAFKGTTLYVGTTAGVEVVSYASATSPAQLKALPAVGSGGVKALKIFVHPAYPQNTFLVTAEGDAVQLLDVSGSTNPAGYEYYAVDHIALTPYGDNEATGVVDCRYIATNGPYLYVLDTAPADLVNYVWPTSYLRPIHARPNLGGFPGTISLSTDGTTPFWTDAGTQWNPSYESWAGLENVQSGILVTGMEQASAVGTIDVATNPLAPTWAPPNTWAFPRFLTNNGWATLSGFAAGNGWIWASGGNYGVMGVSIQPGWQDMEIASLDAEPKYTYPGASDGSFILQGVTTFSATIKTHDAPCRMVNLFWGPVSEQWVGEIPPNTTQTLSWTEDLDTIYGQAASSACGTGNGIYAEAETTDMANCSIYATKSGDEQYRTNVPPPYFSLYNVDPPIPPTDYCTGGGGINSWAVCSPITFNVLWSDCYGNIDASGSPASGITQVALYVDAKLVSVATNPTADYPGPQFTIDPAALGLADGGHSFYTVATNVIGKTSQSTEYPFIVHAHGPEESVTAPAGNVATGSALWVAASATSPAGLPIQWVKFYLDVDPGDPALVPGAGIFPTTGTLIGSADGTDGSGQYRISWDSTQTANGAHSIVAFSTDSLETGACQYLTFSPPTSFSLVPYVAPSVSVSVAPMSGNKPLPVTFTAAVSNGVGPFTYAWIFGDGATGTSNPATHIYAGAGAYTWNLTVTDSRGTTVAATGNVTAFDPPVLATVTKASNPFRLILRGTNFQPNCTVKINGVNATGTFVYASSTEIKQKGEALKSQLPKGTAVSVTVVNPDGGVSNAYSFTR